MSGFASGARPRVGMKRRSPPTSCNSMRPRLAASLTSRKRRFPCQIKRRSQPLFLRSPCLTGRLTCANRVS